jgi:signal transduction histidine kinase
LIAQSPQLLAATGERSEHHGAIPSGPLLRDALVAAAATTLDVALWSDLLVSASERKLQTSSRTAILAFAFVGFVILAWRRRYPRTVFALLCVHSITASLLLSYRPIILVCLALATVAGRERRKTAIGAYGCGVLTSGSWIVNEVRTSPEVTDWPVAGLIGVVYVAILAVAFGAGRWQFATRQRVGQLERQRLEEAERAVRQERLRVARELHDIVAHTVTVMVLQAAGARRVMRTDQGRAELALSEVEQAGTQAMDELRRLLGVLRADDAEGRTGSPPEVALDGGLAALQSLVDTVRRTGMEVDIEVVGEPRRLDPSVDLAAYRVIQEGLTNASKHAGATAHALARLEWRESFLAVTVDDDGTGTTPIDVRHRLSTGHGLLGLGERVELVGGELHTERSPTGGFRLTAVLPLARPAAVRPGADRLKS